MKLNQASRVAAIAILPTLMVVSCGKNMSLRQAPAGAPAAQQSSSGGNTEDVAAPQPRPGTPPGTTATTTTGDPDVDHGGGTGNGGTGNGGTGNGGTGNGGGVGSGTTPLGHVADPNEPARAAEVEQRRQALPTMNTDPNRGNVPTNIGGGANSTWYQTQSVTSDRLQDGVAASGNEARFATQGSPDLHAVALSDDALRHYRLRDTGRTQELIPYILSAHLSGPVVVAAPPAAAPERRRGGTRRPPAPVAPATPAVRSAPPASGGGSSQGGSDRGGGMPGRTEMEADRTIATRPPAAGVAPAPARARSGGRRRAAAPAPVAAPSGLQVVTLDQRNYASQPPRGDEIEIFEIPLNALPPISSIKAAAGIDAMLYLDIVQTKLPAEQLARSRPFLCLINPGYQRCSGNFYEFDLNQQAVVNERFGTGTDVRSMPGGLGHDAFVNGFFSSLLSELNGADRPQNEGFGRAIIRDTELSVNLRRLFRTSPNEMSNDEFLQMLDAIKGRDGRGTLRFALGDQARIYQSGKGAYLRMDFVYSLPGSRGTASVKNAKKKK